MGARNGILLKSGRAIEASKNIKAVVFDKTGTLTFGRPTVNDVLLLSDRCASFFETTYDEKFLSTLPKAHGSRMKTLENIFYLAASAEHGSEHPLAKGKQLFMRYCVTMSILQDSKNSSSLFPNRHHY